MGLGDTSILHHVVLVLISLWILQSIGCCHPFAFFIAFLYLDKVNDRYTLRLRRKLQYVERESANQSRLPLDSESVRWLNSVVERVWPICMEQIASQRLLLPIIPWFLDNYKPWTAKKAAVQQLYLGRSPPIFTEIRVLPEPYGDDNMLLELGVNFLSAEDMIAVLGVQLRKRLGFGMRAKMHVTGMHLEGKVFVGVKFIKHWPFIGRVRVCFVAPPYFQMTVKPIFHHGVDVTELPGIAGWLDKILDIAFEQTLVEPNMLVVDVEKFASSTTGKWFTLDEKHPIAFAKVEIIEASELKAGDISGHADPYVKGKLGPYRFTTKVQKKTLAPRWHEEFKIPISSWESPNLLDVQVCNKDLIFKEALGVCEIDINDLRGGQRHDKWLTLQNIKTGRLHLAITILGEDGKDSNRGNNNDDDGDGMSETTHSATLSSKSSNLMHGNFTIGLSSEEEQKVCNDYKPINTKICGEDSACSSSSDGSNDSHEKYADGNSRLCGHSTIQRGLQKISGKLHKLKE